MWYDDDSKHGNWWDNYDGKGEYLIDGSAESVDKYPHQYPKTESTNFIFIFNLIGLVLLSYIFIQIKRKLY